MSEQVYSVRPHEKIFTVSHESSTSPCPLPPASCPLPPASFQVRAGRLLMTRGNHRRAKENSTRSSCPTRDGIVSIIWGATGWGLLWPGLVCAGVPNGTWLSQPQIRFHSSTNTLSQVMRDIQRQKYKVVFLDFRGVPDQVQQRVSEKAREQRLIPVVWVQSPQYRSLTVAELIHEARYGDGIQVDDHFFAHYSQREFQSLRFQYNKPIFCSIQPFQVDLLPEEGCNQLDVQCYTTNNFQDCITLADQLKAVVSLSEEDTFRYRDQLGVRRFNIFLWPYSNRGQEVSSQNPLGFPLARRTVLEFVLLFFFSLA